MMRCDAMRNKNKYANIYCFYALNDIGATTMQFFLFFIIVIQQQKASPKTYVKKRQKS